MPCTTEPKKLISALEREPATPLRDLDVLPEAERQQLFASWSETVCNPHSHSDTLIHKLFEQQAKRYCSLTALVFEGLEVTYGHLNAQANRLARYLLGNGVTPGMLVGVCMERGCDLITSILGIFKAGAVYMPLDPAYPESRLRFMLEDSGVRLVIRQAHLTLPTANYAGEVINIESVWSAVADGSVETCTPATKTKFLCPCDAIRDDEKTDEFIRNTSCQTHQLWS